MASNFTISQKGKKTVIMRTQSHNKCHVSVIITVVANGNKLPQLFIFKGIPNYKISKKKKNQYVDNKKYM